MRPPAPKLTKEFEGRYDIRRGTAGYAPIIGTFGSLSVPAIVVLLTVRPQAHAHSTLLVPLAAGLLIVSTIAGVTGAIGLAAIGAEEHSTANLVPATMFLAVAVSVSLTAVVAAFEVLATLYLPRDTGFTKTLFTVIVGVAGLAGTFFTALSVADSWHTGPSSPMDREAWRKDNKEWIQSYQQAYWWTDQVIMVSVVPALAGIIYRILGPSVRLSSYSANILVGLALLLSMAAIATGSLRVRHAADGEQRGLRCWEAFTAPLSISCYTLVLMIFLP